MLISHTRQRLDTDDDAIAGADAADEGLDDVENETNFDSNPSTTTLSFAHASISDFFRDPKQGTVTATDEEYPAVGFNVQEAHLSIAKTCLDLVVDYRSLLNRMKEAVSLWSYAANYWYEHLTEVHRGNLDDEVKMSIGISIGRMMEEDLLLPNWVGRRGYSFFTVEVAKSLLSWVTDDNILERLPQNSCALIRSVLTKPIELFEPAHKCISARWLVPAGNEYTATVCVNQIFV